MTKIENKAPATTAGRMMGPTRAPGPSRCGSTQNMSANIKVVVRVRPLNEKETQLNNRVVVDVIDESMLVFDPKEDTRPFFYQGVQQPNKNYLKRANKEMKFVFDHVCNMNATNKDVFEMTTKDMLSSLMEGYNCSVFVYGATGAGKTFTMIGNIEHPGITYLTMEHLFDTINSFEKDREFDIGVSYIEVYNENVFDLLKPSKTPLQLREDAKYGVMVAGLTLNSIKTARELLNMLENGNKNRTQHPTDANAESSRSHAVFQVYVKMRHKTSNQVRIVKLSMIDLAGSERAAATGCVGDRFKEGANINKSLLSLGNCINRLADGSNYIPYRDSKLTRLLKDSLGGNCKTVMIANVSPSSISYEDTYNTLKYAARANKIQLSIKKNIVDGDMRVSQYVKIIEELKKEHKELIKENKELKAQVSLSSMKQASKETDIAKEKVKQEWQQRIAAEEATVCTLERVVVSALTQQRVLALRQRLRARAFTHVASLAHRSSSEAMQQVCTEDIPRQERAAENHCKHSLQLDCKVTAAWTDWDQAKNRLQLLSDKAAQECPDLTPFVQNVRTQAELRLANARGDLLHKLLMILYEEINTSTGYMSEMSKMLKKLFLILKGYDKATPDLNEQYLEVMKKAKSTKGITWSDGNTEIDEHFEFISNLDLRKPILPEFCSEIATDSEDLTDLENKPVSPKKRKGTPMKIANTTIIIDDSLENLDETRNLNSAKKMRREFDIAPQVENYVSDEVNSTFVLGHVKKDVNLEATARARRALGDTTNAVNSYRNQLKPAEINFNDKAKILKPIVGKALPQRRPPLARGPGFGSSLARDGTPLQRPAVVQDCGRGKMALAQLSVGLKAVRPRERHTLHPYSRTARK